jgi:signal transduction histidine kinase
MNISIAETTGIWRYGRLAFTGMGCSLAVCYGKTAILGVLMLFGAAETIDFNPHLQAVSMVSFAVLGLWGLGRDSRQHRDFRPFVLGLTGVVLLFAMMYIHYNRSIEFVAYTFMILSVFWNQNIALKAITEQLRQRNLEIERKNTQLEQASRMKSRFLAAMSHELRTPLNAVIGFSEVLDERMFGELNDKQAEYVKDIHESGRHLLSLINDILDLSKIEAGRMELALTRFDFPQALESAVMLVRERAAKHGLTLDLIVDERLESLVADQRKVKQILLNLLANAVKFTPDGGRIEVRAALAGEAVVLTVSDTGVGIPRDEQAVIFDEFRQVKTDAGRQREGTGLGLALTKRFVEMHHGAIDVRSEPGKGSTFTVTLPLSQ